MADLIVERRTRRYIELGYPSDEATKRAEWDAEEARAEARAELERSEGSEW